MTAAVGEHGYHGVRVADVVWRAGVSRKTFYELFGGKDDCFAATYGVWIDRLLSTTLDAFDDRGRVDRPAARGADRAARRARPRARRGAAVLQRGRRRGRRDATAAGAGDASGGAAVRAPEIPDGPLGETLRAGRVSELGETLRREIAAGRTEQLPGCCPS